MGRRLKQGESSVVVAEEREETQSDEQPLGFNWFDSSINRVVRFDIPAMKPFEGKENLPEAIYREKTKNGEKVQEFVRPGEPRFFMNRGTELILVRKARGRVERRLLATLKSRNKDLNAILEGLRKNRIPGA